MEIRQNEAQLIKQAKRGDERSFETLILSCKGKAYNIALRYMRNEDDALDAVQESFIKIFRSLESFHEDSKFDTWVYRIVVNTCNDLLRKRKHRQEEPLEYETADETKAFVSIASAEMTPEEYFLQEEQKNYVMDCLNQLSKEHREILILRDLQGFSYEETAELLACSVGTVKSRISRARMKLKEIYLQNTEQERVF